MGIMLFIMQIVFGLGLVVSVIALISYIISRRKKCRAKVIVPLVCIFAASCVYFAWFLTPYKIKLPEKGFFRVEYYGFTGNGYYEFITGDEAEKLKGLLEDITMHRLYLDSGRSFPESMGRLVSANDYVSVSVWSGEYLGNNTIKDGGREGEYTFFIPCPEKSVYIQYDLYPCDYINKSSVTDDTADTAAEICRWVLELPDCDSDGVYIMD